jgi:broad specificity phosphatase PhoE
MHIYIRHGNDEKKSFYKHDNSLNSSDETEENIINMCHELINLYGEPKKIYCSPFRRARETAYIIIRKLLPNTQIIIDDRLSRFFSKKDKENPSVRPKTLKYDPPITENRKEFKQRVMAIEKIINKEKSVTWCITHYLVIKQISNKYNIIIPNKMPFLYHVNID